MTTRFSDPVTGQVDPTDTLDPGQVGDGIIYGLSGWFTPYGVRYHEDIRLVSEIDPTDWSALLEHARSVDFFERPERALPGPDDRIIHLRLTVDGRSRELAINDPYETTDLARFVSLVRRALNDRQVVTPKTMSDEMITRLVASLPNTEELRTGRWS